MICKIQSTILIIVVDLLILLIFNFCFIEAILFGKLLFLL